MNLFWTKKTKSLLAIVFLILTWTGCGGPQETPHPDPRTLVIYLSPVVPDQVEQELFACFSRLEGLLPSVYTDFSPYPDPSAADVFLWWGDPAHYRALQEADKTVYQVGELEVGVLTHPRNPLEMIAISELRAVFSGTVTLWTDLTARPPESEIEVWVLPGRHPIQEVFERAVMKGLPVTTTARIAPDLSGIHETALEQEGLIGLTILDAAPQGKILSIQPSPDDLRQPLLLILPDSAPDAYYPLVECLSSPEN